MTLQQLKYFLEVAHLGSIRDAAKTLYVTQPAISKSLQELEEELGTLLYERTPKGIILTQAGRELIKHASQIIAIERDIENEFHGKITQNYLSFSVSTHHFGFIAHAFFQTVQHFSREAYRVRFLETSTMQVLEDVSLKKCDLGFISLKHSARKTLHRIIGEYGLEYYTIHTGKPYVYLAPDHPLSGRISLTKEDLNPYPLISYDQGDLPLELFSEEPFSVPQHFSKVITVNDILMCLYAYKQMQAFTIGTGALLPEYNTECITIPFETEQLYDIYCLFPKGKVLNAPSEFMIRLLESNLSTTG